MSEPEPDFTDADVMNRRIASAVQALRAHPDYAAGRLDEHSAAGDIIADLIHLIGREMAQDAIDMAWKHWREEQVIEGDYQALRAQAIREAGLTGNARRERAHSHDVARLSFFRVAPIAPPPPPVPDWGGYRPGVVPRFEDLLKGLVDESVPDR